MRGAAQRELATLALRPVPSKRRAILSVALVQRETRPLAQGASVACVVSATLRTAKDGVIFAILEGHGVSPALYDVV